ncbi:heme-binding protein 2-like [Ruditapes philippinarum]|uniref:heme-binding protein 2-like n=1 Tax=Ruditapes philippinarum TaxID=129788 RepID=UPI00295BDDE0|nr:heme-binding protein 2-like [Ruditapes philippinarum]
MNFLTIATCFMWTSQLVIGLPHVLEVEPANDEPAFCHKLDCPKFSVIETFKTYELRKYMPSMWVATNLTKMDFSDKDQKDLFDKLFYYISGNNTAHMKIPMTAPVVNTVVHGQGPDCESTFTCHFMIPFDLQKAPPKPTAKDVYITTLPEMSVYVRVFGGYTNGTTVQNNILELSEDINDSSKYITNPYYYAGYDNPYQVLDRHNEVWLRAK